MQTEGFNGYHRFTAGLVAFWPVWLSGRIYATDIRVDDDGIDWWAWGRRVERWLFIGWKDIKVIMIKTIIVLNEKPPTETIYSFL